MKSVTGELHRVVIIGSGFGGLFAAKALRRTPARVTLISKTTSHVFQPLLYQVATGILSEGEVAPATREILKRRRNTEVLLGEVTSIDVQARTVTHQVDSRVTVTGYDSLIVAAGASQSYFGHDEFAACAPGLKTIDDALEIRSRIFGAWERAELQTDPRQAAIWSTFVVVGAGDTGVELAGEISELAQRSLRHQFRRIDPGNSRIILLDGGDAVLRSFGPKQSARVKRQLEKLGVEVQLGTLVTGVDANGVDVKRRDGSTDRIESACVLWAAGVAASPLTKLLADQTGANLDHSGRISCNPDLTLPDHPEIFVVGDMTSLNGLPGVAQVAMQGGKHAAKQIHRRVVDPERSGSQSKPFKYVDLGSMATISRFQAVANTAGLQLHGFVAWLAWLFVHILNLVGFQQKVSTLGHWLVAFIGRSRAERTISGELQRVPAPEAGATGTTPVPENPDG